MKNKLKQIFIFLIIFFFVLNNNLILATQNNVEENSNVLEIRTLPLESNYRLTCQTRNDDQIRININGSAFDSHSLILSYVLLGEVVINPINPEVLTSTSIIPPNQTVNISYFHSNLARGFSFKYVLKIDYQNPTIQDEIKEVICSTLPSVYLPPPSDFKVYSVSPTTLHLTWKDNVTSTQNYGFCLKRIKLTPLPPQNININNSNKTISWINNSNLDNIGPFYHKLILSTDDNIIEDTDDYVGFDGSIGSSISPNSTNINFSYTYDKEIKAAKVWACSFVKLDVNFDGREDEICSEEAQIGVIPTAENQQKTNLLASILNIFNNLVFKFKNFYQFLVDKIKAQEIVDIGPYFNSSKAISLNLPQNGLLGVYQDKNLQSDTVYYYRLSIASTTGNIVNCANSFGFIYNGGKTTKSNNQSQEIKLCVQNSLCKSFTGVQSFNEGLLRNQCSVNADCKDVGSSRRIYQEINR